MGKIIDGKYIYSQEDCRCDFCMYLDAKAGGCQRSECCCAEEKEQARLHFPPAGFERPKRGAPCRG